MASSETPSVLIETTVPSKTGTFFVITRADEDALPNRRPLAPGHYESGVWVATDVSAEPPEVQAAATGAWTPAVIAAYQAAFPYVAPLPPTPDAVRITAIKANARRQALVTAIQGSDDAGVIRYVNTKVTDLPSAKVLLTDLALLVAGVIRS